MNKCLNCLTEDKIGFKKDFDYQFENDSPVEVIDAYICHKCGCIHGYLDNELSFYSWTKDFQPKKDVIKGWSSDYDVKMKKLCMQN